MAHSRLILQLKTPEETDRLGQMLARLSQRGDCILLRGQIGAGKSALARAFIRTLLGPDTDVPSPTFTLVQTYEHADLEIWHADLYRLSDPQDAVELGLTDAFHDNICLIEWPELLGDLIPQDALDIHLDVTEDAHLATLSFTGRWRERLSGMNMDA